MSEAPERIYLDGDVEAGDGMFPRCFENPKYASEPPVEYLRSDHVADMLKAEREKALREAAEVCTNIIKNYDVMEPGKPDQFASLKTQKAAKGMVSLARQDILALISEAATDG